MPDTLNVYSDGSVYPNPGRSAWAFYVKETDESVYAPVEFATVNQIELIAIREAVKYLLDKHANVRMITLHSDSEWSVRSINGLYNGKKNRELISEIQQLSEKLPIVFKHVRAHKGIAGNEKADALSKRGLAEAREKWGEYNASL